MASSGGQPGNRNAVKMKMFDDAMRKFFVQNPEKQQRIIENIAAMAQIPDAVGLGAAKLIIERLDGKAKEYIEVSDPDGNGILSGITVTLVKPALKQLEAESPDDSVADVEFKEKE